MAFEPHELAEGLDRLFARLGLHATCAHSAATRYDYDVTLGDGLHAHITVRPLPAERLNYLGLLPRTLLEAHAEERADLTALRQDVVLAFLRVTG